MAAHTHHTDTLSVAADDQPLAALRSVDLPGVSLYERFVSQIAHTLERHGVSVHTHIFNDPKLKLLELSPAFRSVRDAETTRNLAGDILALCRSSREGAQAVRASVPHLLSLLPLEGKQRILAHVLLEPSRTVRKHCAYAVVRACVSREELLSVLSPSQTRKLLLLNHKPLDEIIGKAETLRALKHLEIPQFKPLHGTPTPSENRRHRKNQITTLRDLSLSGKKNLERVTHFALPRATNDESPERRPAPRALADIYVTISAIARRADLLLASPHYSQHEMETFITSATQRLRVACSDGLRLSQSHTLKSKFLWTEKRVDKLLSALAVIPEGHRLMTPTLRVFHMARMGNLGEWRSSGRVVLGVPGIFRHNRKDEFGGASHMVGVTIHEVAHSLQMSGESPYLTWEPSTGTLLTPTNPLFELATFANLSTWRVIGRISREQVIGADSIRLEDHLIPLNRPLPLPEGESFAHVKDAYRGEWVIFRYDPMDKTLYAHAATAAFSRSSNASRDPFEDWAETFSDYHLCPVDLISLAPEKFYYMELHFKRYLLNRDLPVLKAMYKALKQARLQVAHRHGNGGSEQSSLSDTRQQLFGFVGGDLP